MAKKILIIYASAGVGHKKAAFSLKSALEGINFQGEVKIIDVLDYTTPFFKYTYPKTYLLAIQHLKNVWGFFYYLLDNALFYKICVSWARRMVNFMNSKVLRKFVLEEKPDLVLSTHFFAPEVIGNMKEKGLTNAKTVSVITDFKPHTFWINGGIDFYAVADGYTKDDLLKRGVGFEKIKVFGIPIDKIFSIEQNRNNLCVKLGVENCFTVLIGSGGWGVGPIEELVAALGDMKERIQILVVCGENKKLFEDITQTASGLKNPIKVYKFVNNMDELMSVSDCIVTKSGGLTTSEALAKRLPMIVISPIPGQESRNCDFLIESKAGIRIDDASEVKEKVMEFITSKDAIKLIKNNIEKIRKPNASEDIARFCVGLLGD